VLLALSTKNVTNINEPLVGKKHFKEQVLVAGPKQGWQV
jgi:hypothetical protein